MKRGSPMTKIDDAGGPVVDVAYKTAAGKTRVMPWNDLDPLAVGGFLATFISGLRVASKANPDEVALMRSVEVALSVLD